MTLEDEVQRLESVYADYDAGTERRKGDPRNPGNACIGREVDQAVVGLLSRACPSLSTCRILDVGCGWGDLLGWFHEQGVPAANLSGVDLLPYRIQRARARYPHLTFSQGNAERLDFPDGALDLVLCFLVFSSILDRRMARNVAQSVVRVLRPGGAVFWYDTRFPNPWNRNTRPMTRARIAELFPRCSLNLQSITVIPPLARRLGATAGAVYPRLARIPMLRTHYLGLLTLP